MAHKKDRHEIKPLPKVRIPNEGILIGGSLFGVVIIGLAFFVSQLSSLNPSLPSEIQYLPIQAGGHLNPGEKPPRYNSNPPTSGVHDAQPANWGVYFTAIPDQNVVHNLEHGGIWLSYRDATDAETAEKLQGIAQRYGAQMIVTHRPADTSRIAVAAWGALMKLDSVDTDKIASFVARFRFKGPEN